MPLSCAPFYRFFVGSRPQFQYGPFYYSLATYPAMAAGLNLFGSGLPGGFGGLGLASFGGYFRSLSQRVCGLLLRLRRIPRARRLCQNVRAEEVRLAVVGHQLC